MCTHTYITYEHELYTLLISYSLNLLWNLEKIGVLTEHKEKSVCQKYLIKFKKSPKYTKKCMMISYADFPSLPQEKVGQLIIVKWLSNRVICQNKFLWQSPQSFNVKFGILVAMVGAFVLIIIIILFDKICLSGSGGGWKVHTVVTRYAL